MPEPRSRLPSLDDGVAFAKGVARVLSQMTGDPYGEPALSELEAGEEKSEQGLGNPVAFAHTVIDWYTQATGDFLYGTGEVSRESYNLALSSAAVARSACEYAGIGWWLAEPGILIESRIARTARLVITTHNGERASWTRPSLLNTRPTARCWLVGRSGTYLRGRSCRGQPNVSR